MGIKSTIYITRDAAEHQAKKNMFKLLARIDQMTSHELEDLLEEQDELCGNIYTNYFLSDGEGVVETDQDR